MIIVWMSLQLPLTKLDMYVIAHKKKITKVAGDKVQQNIQSQQLLLKQTLHTLSKVMLLYFCLLFPILTHLSVFAKNNRH